MKVLVDTPLWSALLRRTAPAGPAAEALRSYIIHDRVALIGPVRQEVLSGIRSPEQFARLRDELSNFPDLALSQDDYELAASFYNTCRAQGVQGSGTDFLICAAASKRSLSIATTDGDFRHFARHLPIDVSYPA